MRSGKIPFLLAAAVAAGVLAGGCSTFRRIFDEKPQHRSRQRESKKAEMQRSQDPMFDLLYKRKNDRPGYLVDSKFTPAEREIVNRNLGTPGRHQDPDLIRARDDLQNSSQKRKDWVFGTKDGKIF